MKTAVFVIQAIVIVILIVFAFVQKSQADRAKDEALKAQHLASVAQYEAQIQRKLAEENHMKAMEAVANCENLLKGKT
jgi:hypothetical protein